MEEVKGTPRVCGSIKSIDLAMRYFDGNGASMKAWVKEPPVLTSLSEQGDVPSLLID